MAFDVSRNALRVIRIDSPNRRESFWLLRLFIYLLPLRGLR